MQSLRDLNKQLLKIFSITYMHTDYALIFYQLNPGNNSIVNQFCNVNSIYLL